MPEQLEKKDYTQTNKDFMQFKHTSGGGPYGFSFASNLIISSGFLPRRVDNT